MHGSTTIPHDHRVHSCLHRTCTTTVWSFLPYASSGVPTLHYVSMVGMERVMMSLDMWILDHEMPGSWIYGSGSMQHVVVGNVPLSVLFGPMLSLLLHTARLRLQHKGRGKQ